MVIAHMLQSVLLMRAISLKSEDEIRYLILYQKERLLHEDVENMTTDRRHYLKIVLNNVSKKYKLNHIYKF